jgi:alkaline phosphatase D
MQRRPFLAELGRRAAALALFQLFGGAVRAQPEARAAFTEFPFTLGVASGMPRPDSIVLWTRLAPRPHEPDGGAGADDIVVRWDLAEDERFTRGLRSGTVVARAEHAHSVHVAVTSLSPGRVWYYRFVAGDATSPIGRTRTAPAGDAPVDRLRFVLASCQHYEQGYFAAHREIAARDLDFVLFVGDYIYESSNPRYRIRAHEGPVPRTLAAYRARHTTYKLDADLRAAHAAHPWILTWDDHEVENDYADDHGLGDMTPPQFLLRRAAAYKAYFEHMPLAPTMAPHGPDMRIHDQYAWGRLAELWTLDNRQYRSPQACQEPGRGGGRVLAECAELDDPARTMFGAAQERWLAEGLAASRRQWKLIGQATQISPSGVDVPLGRRIYTDGWDGYPKARERLMQAIAGPHLSDVLCLGGDVHRHVAGNLRMRPNDPASPVLASEFVCSSITSRGVSETGMALIRSSNPDIVYGRGDERGFALVEVTPKAAHCDFRATAFPVAPDARLYTQASVAVEAGRAGVLRD